MGRLWVFAALAAATLSVSASAAPAAAPPFAAGTTWTYRMTVVPATGSAMTGTYTVAFGGPVTYRGAVRYFVELTSTLQPGVAERVYLDWTGTTFRQIANLAADGQGSTLEIIFDKSLPTGPSREELSGTAQILENGTYQGDAPWRVRTSIAGPATVTVPAGPFRTTRWSAETEIGELREVHAIFTVGLTDVRVEALQYRSGTYLAKTTRELISGPVR